MQEVIQEDKTAIIMVGGGMRSAHGAGFLYALATKFNITTPDILIATSGNAGNALYYAAGQFESGGKVWGGLLSTPNFISFRRLRPVMNVDYLIDTVFKKQEPLDITKLAQSAIQWFIPITDVITGITRYVTATDKFDPFELLRAAKAVPVLFERRITIRGKNYFDGEFGPTLEDHLHRAIEHGANKILIVNDAPTSSWLGLLPLKIYAALQPSGLRHAMWRDLGTRSVCMTIPGASIVCVVPKELPAAVTTRDKTKLVATFDRGFADALALEKELRILFPVV